MPDLRLATAATYATFSEIRGLSKNDFPPGVKFWDIVVLTASDEDQRFAYEIQIEEKVKRGEIPSGVHYHVYADPPGPRIGCGGATMRAIVELLKVYDRKALTEKYVLLINAGGLSQRLPSASALGKIFTPLPIVMEDEGSAECCVGAVTRVANWQLLELKLACYLPLLKSMKPGFLHVPSDTIEVFDLGDDDESLPRLASDDETRLGWNFTQPGMTALAHPSSLDIGRTHGVFVLEKSKGESLHFVTELRSCLEVLQKPTVNEMELKGAVFKNTTKQSTIDISSTAVDHLNEFVYTDSSFYFDHAYAEKLASFYREFAPLGCEIDCYSDFMRMLGPAASNDFVTDTRNVGATTPAGLQCLIDTRQRLLDWLRDTPLNVVVMNASKFYHLGTMKEYIENLCEDEELAGYLGFTPSAFSAIITAEGYEVRLCHKDFPGSNRRLLHSIVDKSIEIGCRSVIEYSHLTSSGGINIGSGCIISGCYHSVATTSCELVPVISNSADRIDAVLQIPSKFSLHVPSDIFLHTIPVRMSPSTPPLQSNETLLDDRLRSSAEALVIEGFVTLVFLTSDDVKKTGPFDTIRWLGTTLRDAINSLGLSHTDVFPSQSKSLPSEKLSDNTINLWNARLFPVMNSMSASFEAALDLAHHRFPSVCVRRLRTMPELADEQESSEECNKYARHVQNRWMSAADAVKYKDIRKMLHYRDKLADSIKSALAV